MATVNTLVVAGGGGAAAGGGGAGAVMVFICHVEYLFSDFSIDRMRNGYLESFCCLY